jgi:hypothetical protein
MMRKILILSAILLVGVVAQAANTLDQSAIDPGSTATAENIRLEPCSLTQNDDPTIVGAGSVACSGAGIVTDNWFGRVYDLDGEHMVGGNYCVSDLDYALESVTDATPTTYQVSCVANGTSGNPGGSVTVAALDAGEVFSVQINDGPADQEFFNVALGGCCPSTDDLAMFSITVDCQERHVRWLLARIQLAWPDQASLSRRAGLRHRRSDRDHPDRFPGHAPDPGRER